MTLELFVEFTPLTTAFGEVVIRPESAPQSSPAISPVPLTEQTPTDPFAALRQALTRFRKISNEAEFNELVERLAESNPLSAPDVRRIGSEVASVPLKEELGNHRRKPAPASTDWTPDAALSVLDEPSAAVRPFLIAHELGVLPERVPLVEENLAGLSGPHDPATRQAVETALDNLDGGHR